MIENTLQHNETFAAYMAPPVQPPPQPAVDDVARSMSSTADRTRLNISANRALVHQTVPTAAATLVYTVPANTLAVIKDINLFNAGGGASIVTVWATTGGAAASNTDAIDQVTLAAGVQSHKTYEYVLHAGWQIYIQATVADVAIHISGIEVTNR